MEPTGRAVGSGRPQPHTGSCGTLSLTRLSHAVIDDCDGKIATADGQAAGEAKNISACSWHLSSSLVMKNMGSGGRQAEFRSHQCHFRAGPVWMNLYLCCESQRPGS